MSRLLISLIILSFTFGLSGCASTEEPYMWPSSETPALLPAGAYAADSMAVRKPMPDRREYKDWRFYYKSCTLNGNESYFSKTAYDCNGPY